MPPLASKKPGMNLTEMNRPFCFPICRVPSFNLLSPLSRTASSKYVLSIPLQGICVPRILQKQRKWDNWTLSCPATYQMYRCEVIRGLVFYSVSEEFRLISLRSFLHFLGLRRNLHAIKKLLPSAGTFHTIRLKLTASSKIARVI